MNKWYVKIMKKFKNSGVWFTVLKKITQNLGG